MGRKSKLSHAQWEALALDRMHGVPDRELGRKYGVADTSIRNHFKKIGAQPSVQAAAHMMIELDAVLEKMPISAQESSKRLAASLKTISANLAMAALIGSDTSYRVAVIANSQVDKIDPAAPMDAQEHLQAIAALTRISNDAGSQGLGLLNATKKDAPISEPHARIERIVRTLAKP